MFVICGEIKCETFEFKVAIIYSVERAIEQCTHEKEKQEKKIRSKQNPQQLSNSIHKKLLLDLV